MCAIFGVLDYQGKLTPPQRTGLFRVLADAAQARGTDASGVAYVHNGVVQIQKAPRPACRMRWRIPSQARYLMGHTRMTTQGAASKKSWASWAAFSCSMAWITTLEPLSSQAQLPPRMRQLR